MENFATATLLVFLVANAILDVWLIHQNKRREATNRELIEALERNNKQRDAFLKEFDRNVEILYQIAVHREE